MMMMMTTMTVDGQAAEEGDLRIHGKELWSKICGQPVQQTARIVEIREEKLGGGGGGGRFS